MARPIFSNGILVGISGRLGDVVYRQYKGRTLTCKPPGPRTTPPSPAQRRINEKFKAAGLYAREVMADPERSKAYQKLKSRHASLYHAIMSDFIKNGPLPDGYRITGCGTRVKRKAVSSK